MNLFFFSGRTDALRLVQIKILYSHFEAKAAPTRHGLSEWVGWVFAMRVFELQLASAGCLTRLIGSELNQYPPEPTPERRTSPLVKPCQSLRIGGAWAGGR